MREIGCTVTLATVALWIAGCRPTGLEPPDSVPVSQPGTAEVAETPQALTETSPGGPEQTDQPAKAEAPRAYVPKTSEGRVLGAIGKALVNSVKGETEKEP